MDAAGGQQSGTGQGEGQAPVAVAGGGEGDETNPIEAAHDVDAGRLEASGAKLRSKKRHDGLDMSEVELLARVKMLNGPADLTAAEGSVERRNRDQHRVAIGERGGHERVEEFVLVERNLSGAGELGGELGVPIAGEGGQQMMANAVAGEARVGVGGIDVPIQAVGAQIGHHFVTGYVQQRADEAFAGSGKNCSEAGGAGTAQKTE